MQLGKVTARIRTLSHSWGFLYIGRKRTVETEMEEKRKQGIEASQGHGRNPRGIRN